MVATSLSFRAFIHLSIFALRHIYHPFTWHEKRQYPRCLVVVEGNKTYVWRRWRNQVRLNTVACGVQTHAVVQMAKVWLTCFKPSIRPSIQENLVVKWEEMGWDFPTNIFFGWWFGARNRLLSTIIHYGVRISHVCGVQSLVCNLLT